MSMNTVPERLAALRAAMAANDVAVYLIPVGAVSYTHLDVYKRQVQALLPVAKSVALLTNGAPLTAVFLSKAADPKLRTVVVTAIELLSGLPRVVFGLLGMQVLVPAVAKTVGKASGACLLSAIVVLSIMILPLSLIHI